MAAIKLTFEQSDFIKQFASCINAGSEKWYYLPFLFKQVGENTFQIINFDQIPMYVKDEINKHRNS